MTADDLARRIAEACSVPPSGLPGPEPADRLAADVREINAALLRRFDREQPLAELWAQARAEWAGRLIREAVNEALERAAKAADLGAPSRDWHAQADRDPEAVEAAVMRDIAAAVRALKEPT